MQREEPILQTYVRAEGLLGARSNPNPAICNLSRKRFEVGGGSPETTIDSSSAPQIRTEPKPKKHVTFSDPIEMPAEFYNKPLDKKENALPQDVINKIKAVYFTKET